APPLDISVGADGFVTAVAGGTITQTQVFRIDPGGAVVGRYDLPDRPSENPPEFFYQAVALVDGQLVCQTANDFGFFADVRAFDAATGVTTWSLGDVPNVFGPVALGVDGLGNLAMLDGEAAVHKLTGRAIQWRRAPSHFVTPGGVNDAMVGQDVT